MDNTREAIPQYEGADFTLENPTISNNKNCLGVDCELKHSIKLPVFKKLDFKRSYMANPSSRDCILKYGCHISIYGRVSEESLKLLSSNSIIMD
jgi:hypothetical protein